MEKMVSVSMTNDDLSDEVYFGILFGLIFLFGFIIGSGIAVYAAITLIGR